MAFKALFTRCTVRRKLPVRKTGDFEPGFPIFISPVLQGIGNIRNKDWNNQEKKYKIGFMSVNLFFCRKFYKAFTCCSILGDNAESILLYQFPQVFYRTGCRPGNDPGNNEKKKTY